MLTPHIIRVLDLTEEDLRPLRMPREGDGLAGGVLDLQPPDRPSRRHAHGHRSRQRRPAPGTSAAQ